MTISTVLGESPKLTKVRAPTLAQMIRESRADQIIIGRATRQALMAWFRQSGRLAIGMTVYKLRGTRFLDFARRIGVTDQKSAYRLVHLRRYRQPILDRCADEQAQAKRRGIVYHYPGWERALDWFHTGRKTARYWLTPRDVYASLDAEFHFDFDPCPYPVPKGFDALNEPWGKSNLVNMPFRKSDVIGDAGPMAISRKCVAEWRNGATVVALWPLYDVAASLLEAGAEIRPLGPVAFYDPDTGGTAKHPPRVAAFILRGPNHPETNGSPSWKQRTQHCVGCLTIVDLCAPP